MAVSVLPGPKCDGGSDRRPTRRSRDPRRVAFDRAGSSTTLDAVLFVLLVGGAVAALGGIDPPQSGGEDHVAVETADVLATSTTNVSYSRQLTIEAPSIPAVVQQERVTSTLDREARGTYAALLASAVTGAPTVAGVEVGSADALRREVGTVTRHALPSREANVQVRAVWHPYRGAQAGDTFTVGDHPPADADVSVATATVPSGFPNVTAEALGRAREGGFDGVARAIADGIVAGLFPPTDVRTALYSEGPDVLVVSHRYAILGEALDVATRPTLTDYDVAATNDRLASALADRIRTDLEREFDSPTAAARAIRLDRVQIVVRTWSP